jgi:hypothetical protein
VRKIKALIHNMAICRAAQCFYCGAWFATDTEAAGHIANCGYGK